MSTRVLRRLPALDSIRAIGALAVIAHHVGFVTGHNNGDALSDGILARLDVGVALFFVLSGFLLFRPYAHAQATGGPRPTTGRYLWHRAMRILPAYWLTVIICLTLVPGNRHATTTDWTRYLTLTQIYYHDVLLRSLGHTWSLATEVAFYLVLPLLAVILLGRRWRPNAAIVIAVAALLVTGGWVALVQLGVLDSSVHNKWLPAYAWWFGLGMALAVAHVALRTGGGARWRFLDASATAPLTCWAMALAVLAMATTPIAGPRDLTPPSARAFGLKMLLYGIIAALVLIPLAFGPETRVKAILGTAASRWLGTLSYSLFLWHPFVLEWIYLATGRPEFTGDFVSTYLLTLGGGLVLAALSYYLVEHPLQRWSRQWPRRRPTVTESQSATAVPTAAS